MQIIFEGVHGNDEVYMDCLTSICGDTEGKSMIDICCNLAPHTPKLGFKHRRYIDILDRKLDHTPEQDYFLQVDALTYLKSTMSFDVSICSDGIEHFTKKNGFLLLHRMVAVSDRKVLFTPLGEYMVDESQNPEGHHSGWMPNDFIKNNFAVLCLPNYHPTLGIGAFFAWHCNTPTIEEDFERVNKELKNKSWAK